MSIRLPARLKQEPAAFLGLVYEDFEEARGRYILLIIRKLVCSPGNAAP
jgi:hypothetical protein